MKRKKKIIRKQNLEIKRQHFWAWMMDHHPRLYSWCDKYLPFNTLPF